MLSRQTPEDLAAIKRIISGGDPEWVEDDPADFDPPPPPSAADKVAIDAVLARIGRARRR